MTAWLFSSFSSNVTLSVSATARKSSTYCALKQICSSAPV